MSLSAIATEGFPPPLSGVVTVSKSLSCLATEGFLCSTAYEAAEDLYSGGYFDYEALRLTKRHFKAENPGEKQAKPVLEAIADEIKNPGIETSDDLEIVLRMRLRLQGIRYRALYMQWLEQALQQKQAILRRKRHNNIITILLL